MSDDPHLSSYAAHYRQTWDELSTKYHAKHGPQLAASGGTGWGVWQLPESGLQALGDVREEDVLELGCGAAQWSIALQAMPGSPSSAVTVSSSRT